MRYLSLLLTIIICLNTTSAYASNKERLQPSNLNSHFNFDVNKSFQEYINYSQTIIKSARVDLNPTNQDQIISWNSPFILLPNTKNCSHTNKGILLIHGLTDSPFTTKTIADYLNKNCFTVYSILLTGHGTRPGDLLEVSYKD